MKKIVLIISVLFAAGMMTSCVKPYENEISLAFNNYDVALPKIAKKLGVNGESFHYIQVTATGPWELTLSPKNEADGDFWCWLHDSYQVAKVDEHGNKIVDENGYYLYDEVKVAEGVEYFRGSSTKWRKVRGNSGVTFIPMEYTENKEIVRYATAYVRRTDTGEYRIMNITQSK